jgi:hypothetical protein
LSVADRTSTGAGLLEIMEDRFCARLVAAYTAMTARTVFSSTPVVSRIQKTMSPSWLTQEQNTINAEQAEIDERQEALDVRKRAFERRETTAKRAREAYLHDMQSIDRRLTNPDNDDEDDCAGDGLVGSTRNR